jgi:hypothetical protein
VRSERKVYQFRARIGKNKHCTWLYMVKCSQTKRFNSLLENIHMVDFFFLVGLEFELRASHLQSCLSTARVTPPSPFFLGYLGDGIL